MAEKLKVHIHRPRLQRISQIDSEIRSLINIPSIFSNNDTGSIKSKEISALKPSEDKISEDVLKASQLPVDQSNENSDISDIKKLQFEIEIPNNSIKKIEIVSIKKEEFDNAVINTIKENYSAENKSLL